MRVGRSLIRCGSRWLWSLATAGGCLSATTAFAQDDVSYLNRNRFQIPVQLNPDKASQIKELRLFVSTNKGKSWKMIKSSAPTVTTLNFEAPADGEYWFTLTYLDQNDKLHPGPASEVPAGLKVVIDTKAPTVTMSALPPANGQVGAKWKIEDAKLDPTTLTVEVQKGNGSWDQVRAPQMSEGQYEWSAVPGEAYSMRLKVKDRSGNEGTAKVEIPAVRSGELASTGGVEPKKLSATMPETGFAPPPAPLTEAPVPIVPSAPMIPPPPVVQVAPEPLPPTHTVSKAPANELPTPPPPPAFTPSAPMPVVPAAPKFVSQTNPMPKAPTSGVEESRKAFDPSMTPDIPAVGNSNVAVQKKSAQETLEPRSAPPVNRIPIASTTQQPEIQQVSASKPIEKPTEAPEPKKIPLLNETKFTLNYELRGVGPAGVGKVELFFTKDNGQTWALFGEDADKQPPFDVDLPGEGRYGFKVCVTSRAGLGSKPPQPGESPQMVVEVDTTPPEAELYEPMPDPSIGLDVLTIAWSSKDSHQPPNPVSLYFAERPEGPWYAIKTDLPATGQYHWRVWKDIPYQVYLRLMAADLANNMSVADTPKPVLVDLSRPEASVIGIGVTPNKTQR